MIRLILTKLIFVKLTMFIWTKINLAMVNLIKVSLTYYIIIIAYQI
jgi:hypothetical protein